MIIIGMSGHIQVIGGIIVFLTIFATAMYILFKCRCASCGEFILRKTEEIRPLREKLSAGLGDGGVARKGNVHTPGRKCACGHFTPTGKPRTVLDKLSKADHGALRQVGRDIRGDGRVSRIF